VRGALVTGSGGTHLERLDRMRGEFDDSFFDVAAPDVEAAEAFLVVRLGREHVALRLADLSGFEVAPLIVPVPLELPALMGVSSIGGKLFPVYQLGLLLGRTASSESRHWIATCRFDCPVALAVDGLVDHVEMSRAVRHPAGSAAEPHVTELLRIGDGFRPIVDVASVLRELESLTGGRAADGSKSLEESK
jgi:chemotaxis signal transduction protein